MKLVETITMQKRAVEEENQELKSRLSEMVNERGTNLSAAFDRPATSNGPQQHRPGIPALNLGPQGAL